jgi:hypothetical protein
MSPVHKSFCAIGAYAVDVTDPMLTKVLLVAENSDTATIPRDHVFAFAFHERLTSSDKELDPKKFDAVLLDTTGVFNSGKPMGPQLQYDSSFGMQVSTVGPLFPAALAHLGGMYIERDAFHAASPGYRRKADPDRDRWPVYPYKTYEVMSSAVREDDGTVRRYHGFHAKVERCEGTTKWLRIRQPTGVIYRTIDMNDPTQCDQHFDCLENDVRDPCADERDKPRVLRCDAGEGDEGAIFVALKLCVEKGAAENNPAGKRGREAEGEVRIFGPKQPPDGDGGHFAMERSLEIDDVVSLGAGANDTFAEAVFHRSEVMKQRGHRVKRADDDDTLRDTILKLAASSAGKTLDIIAHASNGVQHLNKKALNVLLKTENPGHDVIKKAFAGCTAVRLLGCHTAATSAGRAVMKELSEALGGKRVYGTLRGISTGDFPDVFRDVQLMAGAKGTERVPITLSTDDFLPGEADPVFAQETMTMINEGGVQAAWLASSFVQVTVTAQELRSLSFDAEPAAVTLRRLHFDVLAGLLGRTQWRVACTRSLPIQSSEVVAFEDDGGRALRVDWCPDYRVFRLPLPDWGWALLNVPPVVAAQFSL